GWAGGNKFRKEPFARENLRQRRGAGGENLARTPSCAPGGLWHRASKFCRDSSETRREEEVSTRKSNRNRQDFCVNGRQEESIVAKNLWSDAHAASLQDDLDLLVYRSNLLGEDRSVCNWKGGNTSTKVRWPLHTGQEVEVMWIKGSGSDLKTIQRDGFTGLRLDDVLALFQREEMSDEEMVDYLVRSMLHPSMPRPSIETLMHAFIPFPHVDHTHPDAIVTLCNLAEGKEIVRQIFGDSVYWVDYVRPGFSLAKQVGRAVRENPNLRGVFLGNHGLVTWGNTHKESYENTLALINEAQAYID